MGNENKKSYVAYYRVSTQKQNASHLGLEAQRKTCGDFVRVNNGVIVNEFTDVESGKSTTRKGLFDAIDYCKENECSLVVARLDRLARNIEFTFKIINTGIDIHFCDMPMVNTMILGVFASVAQYERELVSIRTKAALKALKDRGVKLGAPTDANVRKANEYSRIAITNKAKENENNKEFKVFMEVFEEENNIILKRGIDQKYFDMLASKLNRHGKKTQKGLEWNKDRVYNIVKRIKERYRLEW